MIPLYKPHLPPHIADRIAEVIASGQMATGPLVAQFEDGLRKYLGTPRLIVNGDVSTALTLCLFRAGVRPDDEVLMSPLVCLSTSCPVKNLFAKIRWCDVDPRTGMIDVDDMAKRVTSKTKAVIVYHWAGNPADLDAIHAVAKTHGLKVIEDAGEALGAEYAETKVGAGTSDFTVFSFYPNRHLTTIDGAAITCAAAADFDELVWLRRYGIHQPTFRAKDGEIDERSDIKTAGWNSYLSHVAGTIGVAQLPHLPSIVERHQSNGSYYEARFAEARNLRTLTKPRNSRSAYWVYTLLARDRDRLLAKLREKGIYASKVHLRNDVYTCFENDGHAMPGVDEFSRECLSIPSGWWVTEDDRKAIADIVCAEAVA